jgi:hypothetical protein
MKFTLGQKVKASSVNCNSNFGRVPASNGVIVCVQFLGSDENSGEIQYSVKTKPGHTWCYPESALTELKVQTLFAYKDATDEVHWSTRKYDAKERANFGFQEAFDFNKTIDLE